MFTRKAWSDRLGDTKGLKETILFVTIILDPHFLLKFLCSISDSMALVSILRHFRAQLVKASEENWEIIGNHPDLQGLHWFTYLCESCGYPDIQSGLDQILSVITHLLELLNSVSNTEYIAVIRQAFSHLLSPDSDDYLKQLRVLESLLRLPGIPQAKIRFVAAIERVVGVFGEKENKPDPTMFDVLDVRKQRDIARKEANALQEIASKKKEPIWEDPRTLVLTPDVAIELGLGEADVALFEKITDVQYKWKLARWKAFLPERLHNDANGTLEEIDQMNRTYREINVLLDKAYDARTKAKNLSRLLMQLLNVPRNPWRGRDGSLGSRDNEKPQNKYKFVLKSMNIEICKMLLQMRNTMMFDPPMSVYHEEKCMYDTEESMARKKANHEKYMARMKEDHEEHLKEMISLMKENASILERGSD